MPHIRIRAMTVANVKHLSQVLPKELALIMNTSEDNFTTEKIESAFYRDGVRVSEGEADPMIEIHWFDRGPEVKAAVAKKVTAVVQNFTKSAYIAVVFFDLPKTNYFENGEHF